MKLNQRKHRWVYISHNDHWISHFFQGNKGLLGKM